MKSDILYFWQWSLQPEKIEESQWVLTACAVVSLWPGSSSLFLVAIKSCIVFISKWSTFRNSCHREHLCQCFSIWLKTVQASWWCLPSLAHGLPSAQIFPLCLIFRAAGLLSAIPAALKPITLLLIPLLQDTIPMMVIKILSMLTGKLYFSHSSTLMAW